VPTTAASPERWAAFLEDHVPGLTWLAATLREWAELPPGARRTWRVTASASRTGEVGALAALHEADGLLAVAATPGFPPPFLGTPETVRRLIGEPDTVEAVFAAEPWLAVRRLPGVRRSVVVFDGDAPPRPAGLRTARDDEWEILERMRRESDLAPDLAGAADLAGPCQAGLVWTLTVADLPQAMFRVEGVSRRRVQVTDACVHPSARGRGLGAALLRGAASVARSEYARGIVLAMPEDEPADRTAVRAGYRRVGLLDDIGLS
jgi:GNAT superfamily N-acetyltransferase